jgi:secreted trypsin-like serine protease
VLHLAEAESRILGGRNAALGEIPYQASLMYWGTTFHFASGVLLNSRWVVTTAKGLFGRPGNSINIVLGVIRRDVTFTNRQSNEIRIHPAFNFDTRQNE